MAPGRLDAWVAQSALKYRPRKLSKCRRTTKDDRVSQEIAPHTVTPCEIAVCHSTINAGSDTCAVVISTETESGFITEDDTSPVCHTPSCPRSAKIQSTLPMMWGQCDVVGKIARSSRSFVFLGRPDPPRYTLPSVIHCYQHRSNYHIAPTEVAADTSIRPTCFSEAYYTAPYQSPSAARTAAGYVLEAS
ncbi:hypothetical protein TNCV_50451 [Trichonephila clavipes]|nr:hypothetical protein TNCV_50451 [Trichonephila clavipes]